MKVRRSVPNPWYKAILGKREAKIAAIFLRVEFFTSLLLSEKRNFLRPLRFLC